MNFNKATGNFACVSLLLIAVWSCDKIASSDGQNSLKEPITYAGWELGTAEDPITHNYAGQFSSTFTGIQVSSPNYEGVKGQWMTFEFADSERRILTGGKFSCYYNTYRFLYEDLVKRYGSPTRETEGKISEEENHTAIWESDKAVLTLDKGSSADYTLVVEAKPDYVKQLKEELKAKQNSH